jgi:leucyl-tRNA synthetase
MDSPHKIISAYQPQAIEAKWQRQWEADGLYLASQNSEKPKFYCLDFFPYPSGEGLHVGHCRNYVPTDVMARFKRMRGYNVLHPMGWDAFGEPAEQYAVRQGVHPRQTTDQNTANFRRQMTLIGKGIDWSREIDSSKPEFYRWTQKFFLLMYRRGLVYRDNNRQWWCPVCQTTLSSHEAAGGVCWRGHTGLTRKLIPAWYFRITAYADELLSGLDEIDWPERIKAMQRNWIGRSEGVEITFPDMDGASGMKGISVFTTRADTLFGVTYLVLAPEHPMLDDLIAPEYRPAVDAYRRATAQKSEVERIADSRTKTGVFTGGYVQHPLSGELIPVWTAVYVLAGYGSGAVMGVPAHDERDFDFAHQFGLPIRTVVLPADQPVEPELPAAYTGEGILVHSGVYSGKASAEAAATMADDLEARGLGRRTTQYRMRDWLISRQRYWGTPIPIIHCQKCGPQPVPEEQLPVVLPPMQNFTPDGSGRSPLARLEDFVNTTCPVCDGPAQRETDTMGGFACSSWYFLRFTSPHEMDQPFEPSAMRYWMPVDLYVGGAEHAVLHLLYARFWTKVLADEGMLPFREPFAKLLNQGQLMGVDGQRMAKSRGNVITPDSMVAEYGADALRLYVMFMAPFDQDADWSMEGIHGVRRFLNRVWNLYMETHPLGGDATGQDPALERILHRTIRRLTERIETFRLNTMVSTLMEFVNALAERQRKNGWQTASFHHAMETLLVLLAPAAPHLAEELWHLTHHNGSVHMQPWPAWDEELAREEMLAIAVQVDGKVRLVMDCPADFNEEQVRLLALQQERVKQVLVGRLVTRTVYVPGKVFSIVSQEV